MSETCRIQWIDENGKPTPDENPAVGRAVHTRTYTRGAGIHGDREEVESWPICAQHKAQADADGLFGRRETFDGPMFATVSGWSFEPLA